MATTFRKLRDGSWGIGGPKVELRPGRRVTVKKGDGSTKLVTVGRVVAGPFSDGNVLATIAGQGGGQRGSRGRRVGRYECEECGDYVTPGTRCWETGIFH